LKALSKITSKKLNEQLRASHVGRGDAAEVKIPFRRAEVLLSSYGMSPEIMDEKMSLMKDLWGADLPSDFSYANDVALTIELQWASQQGYIFVVIFKKRMDSNIYLKVKNLITRAEVEGILFYVVEFFWGPKKANSCN
jgi:histidyl-tRNA synthetase